MSGTSKARFAWLPLLWLPLFALAIAAIIVDPLLTARRLATMSEPFATLGLRTVYSGGRYVLTEPWSRAGDLAQVRQGDLIVAIDGRPAPLAITGAHYKLLARQLSEVKGSRLRLRTRSVDGVEHDLNLVRNVPAGGRGLTLRGMEIVWSVESAIYSLIPLSVAALLVLRRPRDRAAAVMSASLLFIAMQGVANELAWVLGTSWPATAVAAPSLILLVVATLIFPDGRLRHGSGPILAGLAAWSVFELLWPFGLAPRTWNAMASLGVNAVAGLLFIGAAAVQATAYRRLPQGRQRQQIQWALFGFVFGATFLLAGRTLGSLPPADPGFGLWVSLAATTFNTLAILAVCTGLAISMLRYRLYDADMVISRSAGYALLTLGLAGVWAGAEKTLEVLFEGQFGHEAGAASAGVAAALAALLVTPAHHRVMHWTEQVFQKGLARLRRDLPQTVGDLRETATVERIAETVLARVGEGVRAAHAAVVLDGKVVSVRGLERKAVVAWLRVNPLSAETAERDRDDLLLPMRRRLSVDMDGSPRTVGWLLLGPRPDGSFYGKDETEALGDIADPVARALHIATQRQAREIGLARELKAIRAELAALRPA